MVHNGVEYADMQLIAETYDLLKTVHGMSAPEIGDAFASWKTSPLDSYLIDITAEVLHKRDAGGAPLVDRILDEAEQKGTGRWTAQSALDLGVPITAITEAVYARALSSKRELRAKAEAFFPHPHASPRKAGPADVEAIRNALYASKIVAYAQGFEQMSAASAQYGWRLDLAEIASIWRAGCIIRARMLDRIMEAYEREPALASLLLAEHFRDAIAGAESAWRKVVGFAVGHGVPTPAFSSTLAYYDGVRRARGPANLLQGLRDYFGAHTYRRLDKPGVFHTRWSQDGAEVKAD
jgi:6-phosphogluconate dehydrogenase